jgi:hypothetical protein
MCGSEKWATTKLLESAISSAVRLVMLLALAVSEEVGVMAYLYRK